MYHPLFPTMLAAAATVALGVAWMLPLSWGTVVAAALAFVALPGIERARRKRARSGPLDPSIAATLCVSLVGWISVAYAALALASPERVDAGSRLGYPFLISTGLRLPGGAGLLALCALVSVIPALSPDVHRASSR